MRKHGLIMATAAGLVCAVSMHAHARTVLVIVDPDYYTATVTFTKGGFPQTFTNKDFVDRYIRETQSIDGNRVKLILSDNDRGIIGLRDLLVTECPADQTLNGAVLVGVLPVMTM